MRKHCINVKPAGQSPSAFGKRSAIGTVIREDKHITYDRRAAEESCKAVIQWQ